MASTDATPFPVKNQAYRVVFPILDADGDLVTGASSLDSEVSKDQGAFTDCTNEATEIATNSGVYYLDLTATEMNADCVSVIVKSTEGKTTVLTLYPSEAADWANLWAHVMENSITAKHAMNLFLAVLTGKASGLGTTTAVYRDTADSKNRISATVDADGNRTAVGTRDGT